MIFARPRFCQYLRLVYNLTSIFVVVMLSQAAAFFIFCCLILFPALLADDPWNRIDCPSLTIAQQQQQHRYSCNTTIQQHRNLRVVEEGKEDGEKDAEEKSPSSSSSSSSSSQIVIPRLYWVANQAGLYSHFLQMKIMLQHMASSFPGVRRQLVVVATRSPHYGKQQIDLCRIFKLPSANVTCSEDVPKDVKCRTRLKPQELANVELDVCFSGSIKFNGENKARHSILTAVNYLPNLQFHSTEWDLVHRFQNAMMQMKHNDGAANALTDSSITGAATAAAEEEEVEEEEEAAADIVGAEEVPLPLQRPNNTPRYGHGSMNNHNYTVVHWRRGDQLKGRCRQKMDVSVNCKHAAQLIAEVRKYSNDSVVYVATNEPQDSVEMDILRKEAGFLSWQDVYQYLLQGRKPSNPALPGGDSGGDGNSTNAVHAAMGGVPVDVDVFQILVIETGLMLEASTFLAWGISEVNDVVEHERMRAQRRHCIGQAKPSDESQDSWCSLNTSIH